MNVLRAVGVAIMLVTSQRALRALQDTIEFLEKGPMMSQGTVFLSLLMGSLHTDQKLS